MPVTYNKFTIIAAPAAETIELLESRYDAEISITINDLVISTEDCAKIVALVNGIILKHTNELGNITQTVNEQESKTKSEAHVERVEYVTTYLNDIKEAGHLGQDLVQAIIDDQKSKTNWARFPQVKLDILNELLGDDYEDIVLEDYKD
jgi:hypothetical protein